MQCPRCQQDNPSHAKFCLECGAPFKLIHESGPLGASYADLEHALSEALEQQTATSEILGVISRLPTDLQPVMDAVAENAARVCGAADASIRRIEGHTLQLVARFGSIPFVAPDVIPISRDYPSGRAVIERRTIHIDDILPRLETEFPGVSRELRTVLATPLLREGVPIGAIVIRRAGRHRHRECPVVHGTAGT